LFQYLNRFGAPLVAQCPVFLHAGQLGVDDVDGQAAFQQVVQRGDGPGQHGRVHLAATDGHQQVDLRRLRGQRRRKQQRVLPHDVGRRQQDVPVAHLFGREQDLAAVFVVAPPLVVEHPQVRRIAAAQVIEPGNFNHPLLGADGDGGKGFNGKHNGNTRVERVG
jgi:hypothetical protein